MRTIGDSHSRLLAALLVAAGAFTGPAPAATTVDHHHDTHAAVKPLAKGQKWTTDAPLRDGMNHIRRAIAPQLDAVHKNTLKPEQYKQVATEVETQVAAMVANCKLPPDADAALHVIIGQMMEGSEAMSGKSKAKPRDGAVKLVVALDKYGREFDHPGWKPLKH